MFPLDNKPLTYDLPLVHTGNTTIDRLFLPPRLSLSTAPLKGKLVSYDSSGAVGGVLILRYPQMSTALWRA